MRFVFSEMFVRKYTLSPTFFTKVLSVAERGFGFVLPVVVAPVVAGAVVVGVAGVAWAKPRVVVARKASVKRTGFID